MKKTRIIFVVLVLFSVGFIWINSIVPAGESGRISSFVRDILNFFLGGKIVLSENAVRKLAHFMEFAFFGIVFSLLLWDNLKNKISFVILCGLFTAVLDETIQLFTDGRSSQIKDVWIDFTGFVLSVLVMTLINFIISLKKKKKRSD